MPTDDAIKPYAHFGRLMRHHRGGEPLHDVADACDVGIRTLAETESGSILPTCKTFGALIRHYRTRPGVPPLSDAAVAELVAAMGMGL